MEGSQYSKIDRLEVILNYDKTLINGGIAHTIDMVSGPVVTHGGGGNPGETLHYKSAEHDASEDGVIDYTSVEMEVVQSAKGTSVIKVVAVYLLQADVVAFEVAQLAWVNEPESDTKVLEQPDFPSPRIIKTGDITLAWEDATFV